MKRLTKTEKYIVEREIVPTNRFRMIGYAIVKGWYGDIMNIEMSPEIFTLEGDITNEKLLENANDNGFGCQEFLGVVADVYQEAKVKEKIGDKISEEADFIYIGNVNFLKDEAFKRKGR